MMYNCNESQKDKLRNAHNHYCERSPLVIKKDTSAVTPIRIHHPSPTNLRSGRVTAKDWRTMPGNWELYITSWELYITSFPNTLPSSKSKKHQPAGEAVTENNWGTTHSTWEILQCISLCRSWDSPTLL